MKINIELEGTDPRFPAVMAALMGTTAPVAAAPVASAPKADSPRTTVPVSTPKATAPKVEETKVEEADEGNGSAASSDAQDQPTTTAPSQASTSAPSKGAGDVEVDLPKLQELAAALLQAGERRTLKSILDENGVKSLSTAPADAYPMLFGALLEAVEALAAA